MQNEQVAVEQIDRSEAWPFRPSCYKADDAEKWLSGLYDSVPVIQAFARHRTRAIEASQTRQDDVETLATALFEGVEDRAWSDPHIGLLDRDEWRSLAAKGLRALTTPTRIEAAQPQEAETAWLIERHDLATVESRNSVCLHYYAEWPTGKHYWTPDHLKAKRFACKDAAKAVSNNDPLLSVVEHMWINTPPPLKVE